MTKRPKVDGPAAILTGRLVRPAGSGPLPHDLPAAACERLFVVTLLRLARRVVVGARRPPGGRNERMVDAIGRAWGSWQEEECCEREPQA